MNTIIHSDVSYTLPTRIREMSGKKALLVFIALLAFSFSTAATTESASAWWRGGGYRGGFGGGCRWGGCGGVGAGVAAGLAGLAVGAIAGAAISSAAGGSPAYGYPAYGCVRHPTYDAYGNFVGYSC